jgi:uncharacterized oxidoreductase
MKTRGNTILITGGATGIGFALAEAFAKAGNTVIICGRRENRLKEACARLPGIETLVCDVSKKRDRESLFRWVKNNYPALNVLVNNAGVQKMVDLTKGARDLLEGENEIATNLVAPIHLTALFIPLLSRQKEAAIINVSSGLGFVPIAAMPVYCATKAGVHLFTVSLRHQLKGTPVKVFEIVPPMVDTELGRDTTEEPESGYRGIPPAQVATETMRALRRDEFEILVGEAKDLLSRSRSEPEKAFADMNNW